MVASPRAERATLHDRRMLPWQSALIGAVCIDGEPMHAIRGGLGSGKSAALCVLVDALCETRPGASVVLGMDSYPRLERVHLPLLQALAPDAVYSATSRRYDYPNGSKLYLVHVDGPRGAVSPIEGHNAHTVALDEAQALRPDVLDVAQSRARIAVKDVAGIERQPVVITCGVPVEPAWWIDRTREAGGRIWLPQTADNAGNLGASYLARMRALLSDRDYQALVENRPLPPVGQALYAFRPEPAPDGCIAPSSWRVDRSKHRLALTVDFGLRHPAAMLLAEDTELGAWVVCREWAPDDCTTPELGRLLARDLAGLTLAFAYADPAGAARNPRDRIADLDVLAAPAPDGIGRRPLVTFDPIKRDISVGITRLNLAFERRRLLIAADLYAAGMRAPANKRTLARALTGYRIDERSGEPEKDGVHDHHIDALRYFAQHRLWTSSPMDGRVAMPPPADNKPTRGAQLMRGKARWAK